jgi:hypothetical protein
VSADAVRYKGYWTTVLIVPLTSPDSRVAFNRKFRVLVPDPRSSPNEGGGKGIDSSFLLVLGNEAEPSTREAANQLVESFSNVLELRFVGNEALTLVRPDGYVAYSSRRSDNAGIKAVRAVLERQTIPPENAAQAA